MAKKMLVFYLKILLICLLLLAAWKAPQCDRYALVCCPFPSCLGLDSQESAS